MGKKGIIKCIEVIQNILSHGFKRQVPRAVVERTIQLNIGMDERTIQKYLVLLAGELGFLRVVNSAVFEIDIASLNFYLKHYYKTLNN